MTITFRNSDKVWHFLISIVLVFIAFLFLTYCVNKGCKSHHFNLFSRLGLSGLFSLMVGMLKVILDAVSDDWSWCAYENCDFSIWDVVIYVDGVVLGVLLIVSVKMVTAPPRVRREPPCDMTVASSIDGDDDNDPENPSSDNNNANHAGSSKHGLSDEAIPVEISITDESSDTDESASTNKSTSHVLSV
jgi:hypothetical protein